MDNSLLAVRDINHKHIVVDLGEQDMGEWKRIMDILPEEYKVVETKIDDGRMIRNQQNLYRYKNLWFLPDGSMYVYYTPTHWREIED